MSVIPVRTAATPGIPATSSDNAAVAHSPAVTAASIANRQAMPQVAAVVDHLRSVFGTNQVHVMYACEREWPGVGPGATAWRDRPFPAYPLLKSESPGRSTLMPCTDFPHVNLIGGDL